MKNKRWTFTIDGEKHDVRIERSYRSKKYAKRTRDALLNETGAKWGFDSHKYKEQNSALLANPKFPDVATIKIIVDGEIIHERKSKMLPYDDMNFDVGNKPAVIRIKGRIFKELELYVDGKLII